MKFASYHGQWRIVVQDNSVRPDAPGNQRCEICTNQDAGLWVFPDCGYHCTRCGACLGCLRKIVHGALDDGIEWSPCPVAADGLHEVCDGSEPLSKTCRVCQTEDLTEGAP